MQQDQAGIDFGKEVAAQERHQRKRHRNKRQQADHHGAPMVQGAVQDAVITLAKALEASLETTLEIHQRVARRRMPILAVHMRFEQVVGEGRHQGPRQDERGDHGEDHRFGHWHEQEARHAVEEEHRHEHDADTQQRDECRGDDLRGAVEDRSLHRLALLQVPVDVLDGHRGVVHQNPHCQRQATEGHDIQGFAKGRQRGNRGENRQRNRGGDDHRRTPTAEEQQNHQTGQRRRYQAFTGHAADGRAHEQRLVADQVDIQVGWQGGLVIREFLLDPGDHAEGRSRTGLEHWQQYRAVAVHVHDIGLRRVAVAHRGHVADQHGGAVGGLDWQVFQVVEVRRGVVQLQVEFVAADLLRTHRGDQVLGRQRIGNVLRRQATGLHAR